MSKNYDKIQFYLFFVAFSVLVGKIISIMRRDFSWMRWVFSLMTLDLAVNATILIGEMELCWL